MVFLVFIVVFGLVSLDWIWYFYFDFDGNFDWIWDFLDHWIRHLLLDRIRDILHHLYGVRAVDGNLNRVVDGLFDRVRYDLLNRHVHRVRAVDWYFDWYVDSFLDWVRHSLLDVHGVRFVYVHGIWAIHRYLVGYVHFFDHGVWMGHWNFDGIWLFYLHSVRLGHFNGVRPVNWNGNLDRVWVRFGYFHRVWLWHIFGYGLDGHVMLVR